jgi:hypothetical protein
LVAYPDEISRDDRVIASKAVQAADDQSYRFIDPIELFRHGFVLPTGPYAPPWGGSAGRGAEIITVILHGFVLPFSALASLVPIWLTTPCQFATLEAAFRASSSQARLGTRFPVRQVTAMQARRKHIRATR